MDSVKIYRTKSKRLGGTSYAELIKKARRFFRELESKTKRRPYIRSAYFGKDKIFFDYFWTHLNQKPPRQRQKRLAYIECGIELIQNSRYAPISKTNPNRKTEIQYRFSGVTPEDEAFFVQIKEDTKTKNKFLMSIFPPE
ncbi:MAG TPA: hypothetical protein VLE93_00885 [Candidatus Saccharimonadales bacterium]|nr:hypothetical protein [Candidatus Saccharimonadales bacterium]